MRRARWGALLVCVVAILMVMLAPAASAKSATPTPVLAPASGVWTWTYVDFGISWDAVLGDLTYSFNDAERGTWKGTFNGKSVEPWCVYGDTEGNAWALISIGFRGKVAGHHGTADIALTVEIPGGMPEGTPMTGHWSVVRGTGGLKGLFGMGTWTEDVVAEAEAGTGVANYSGAWWLAPAAPSIAGLKPASAKRGALVTISGTDFGAARGTSAVKFGSTTCTKYVSWSDGRIKCRVPAKAKYGVVKITVTTTAGKSNALSFKVKR